MAKYTLEMREECGGQETVEITADNLDDAVEEADDRLVDWIEDGDYGTDGASVSGSWRLLDEDGDEAAKGHKQVEVEPCHGRLITEACGGVHDDRYDRLCGEDPDDHTWTSEGEGGCDSNPGVWATGGTSMEFASHCCQCGLHRVEHHTGSQRNPGEHDTVEYTMPQSWCETCQDEECDCDEEDGPWVVVRQDSLQALQQDGTWGDRLAPTVREYTDHDEALEAGADAGEAIGRMVTVQESQRYLVEE